MRYWNGLLFSGLASASALVNRDAKDALAKCPGYKASNVKTTGHGLSADLTLAGKACNAYGDDLKKLVLEVAYESGKSCKYVLCCVVLVGLDGFTLS